MAKCFGSPKNVCGDSALDSPNGARYRCPLHARCRCPLRARCRRDRSFSDKMGPDETPQNSQESHLQGASLRGEGASVRGNLGFALNLRSPLGFALFGAWGMCNEHDGNQTLAKKLALLQTMFYNTMFRLIQRNLFETNMVPRNSTLLLAHWPVLPSNICIWKLDVVERARTMQCMFVLEASLCPNKSSRVTNLANMNSGEQWVLGKTLWKPTSLISSNNNQRLAQGVQLFHTDKGLGRKWSRKIVWKRQRSKRIHNHRKLNF